MVDFLDDCRENHDELPLVDPYTHLPPCHIQVPPCYKLALILLEGIIQLIGSAFLSLLLPKLSHILCKNFEAFSEIHVRL